MGFVPGAAWKFPFSPDGVQLVLRVSDRISVVRAEDLREERSRPASEVQEFLANDELLIQEKGAGKGWDVVTDRRTFCLPFLKALLLR